MIYHSKGLDLEITDFEYHDDPTYTGEIMPSQSSRCYTLIIFYTRDGVDQPMSFVEASQKRRSSIELSNNISDLSEAKGTGILSDLLLGERSEVSGKSAIYYIINGYNFRENLIQMTHLNSEQ